jgi:hypothetical protein
MAGISKRVVHFSRKKHEQPVVQPSVRKIPSSASRVLDAPNLKNDFYYNPLAWSSRDLIAVALST